MGVVIGSKNEVTPKGPEDAQGALTRERGILDAFDGQDSGGSSITHPDSKPLL